MTSEMAQQAIQLLIDPIFKQRNNKHIWPKLLKLSGTNLGTKFKQGKVAPYPVNHAKSSSKHLGTIVYIGKAAPMTNHTTTLCTKDIYAYAHLSPFISSLLPSPRICQPHHLTLVNVCPIPTSLFQQSQSLGSNIFIMDLNY